MEVGKAGGQPLVEAFDGGRGLDGRVGDAALVGDGVGLEDAGEAGHLGGSVQGGSDATAPGGAGQATSNSTLAPQGVPVGLALPVITVDRRPGRSTMKVLACSPLVRSVVFGHRSRRGGGVVARVDLGDTLQDIDLPAVQHPGSDELQRLGPRHQSTVPGDSGQRAGGMTSRTLSSTKVRMLR